MNFISEIEKLPNFGYIIDRDNGKVSVVVLGGHTVARSSPTIHSLNIIRLHKELTDLYNKKEEFTDDDKHEFVYLMKKMQSLCESRFEGLNTIAQQRDFITSLSCNETKQLEQQIEMYKTCRQYYRDFH